MKTIAHGSVNRYGRSKLSLVWLEFKKLFMPKRIGFAVLVLLLGGLWLYPFHVLYLDSEFKNWNTAITVDMEAKYGDQISADEAEQFKQSLAPKIAEADAYIRSTPAFAKANLDSYERYIKRSGMADGGTMPLWRIIQAGPARDLFAELQASFEWIQSYEDSYLNTLGMNKKEKKRVAEIRSRDWVSVLPTDFLNNYNSVNLLNRLAIAAMLITSLLVMHIHIGDRRSGLGEIQAASKAGVKGLFRIKIGAALLAGTFVAAVLFVVLLLAYRFSGTWSLMGADISRKGGGFFWYDMSFLQYMCVTYAAVVALCWIAALLTVFFSSIAPNYIVLAGAVALTLILFFEGDYFLNPMLNNILSVGLGRGPFQTFIELAVLLAISSGLLYIAWKRESRRIRW